jgi:uncharacterized protein
VRYVLAGASGFLGTALRARLADAGHEVVRLVRRPAAAASESTWDPYAGKVDADVVAGADVVVNLAGVSLVHWPWTESYRRQILQSRIRTTETLATSIADVATPPAYVVASAVGWYGVDRGDEMLTEDSRRGAGFMTDVVRAWEEAADPAREAGARVCHLRSGVVIDRSGSALRLMRLPFWLGLGSRIGSGVQYFPIISLDDWLRATQFVAESDLSGAFNLAGPEPPTNAEFTQALAGALHRPAFLRAPAIVLRTVLGEVSGELLGSRRVLPKRLADAGFEFDHRDVDTIIAAGLHR